jgi:hypothetical protein
LLRNYNIYLNLNFKSSNIIELIRKLEIIKIVILL